MAASARRRDRQLDRRKRWHKRTRARTEPQRTYTPVDVTAISKRITAIPRMALQEIQALIEDARLEENVSS